MSLTSHAPNLLKRDTYVPTVAQGTSITLTAEWYEYPGGPPADVTSVTITITPTAGGAAVVGPTSSGVTNPSTGVNVYTWTVALDRAIGDYLVVWDGVDASLDAVQATELVTVTAGSGTYYASLADLKTSLRITDTDNDTELLDKLNSASRRVDRDTGRRFWADAVTSSRIYTPHHEELLPIDDVATSSGLVVEIGRGSTWTAVDTNAYDLLPQNAAADGRAIETLTRVLGYWPMWGLQRVRVTAQWGWPAVPEEIHNATLLLAARLFRRKDSPEGVQGFSDLGVVRVSRYDPDYDALIGPYVRDVK